MSRQGSQFRPSTSGQGFAEGLSVTGTGVSVRPVHNSNRVQQSSMPPQVTSDGLQGSFTTPTEWSVQVEEAYRFQVAGYRDEREYCAVRGAGTQVERWAQSGFVKKLQRRDGTFYYFDRTRELTDKDIGKYKIYSY